MATVFENSVSSRRKLQHYNVDGSTKTSRQRDVQSAICLRMVVTFRRENDHHMTVLQKSVTSTPSGAKGRDKG